MKKTLVCIFAHPDDESFGPSGTIHKFTATHDVFIICATNGDAGENHLKDSKTGLGRIRQEELRSSAALLGVKNVFFLNYHDATLSNIHYHAIASDIMTIIDDLRPETLMTFEHRGVSGHLDHIAISMITTYVFERVSYAKTLFYYCLPEEYTAMNTDYFIYFPQGYSYEEIDKIVDVSDVLDLKRNAMSLHKSQEHDARRLIALLPKRTKEHFLLRSK